MSADPKPKENSGARHTRPIQRGILWARPTVVSQRAVKKYSKISILDGSTLDALCRTCFADQCPVP